MSDEQKHHSHGVCLQCGGHVDEGGMSRDSGVDEQLEQNQLDPSGGPTADAAEEVAAKNAREFARHLQRTG